MQLVSASINSGQMTDPPFDCLVNELRLSGPVGCVSSGLPGRTLWPGSAPGRRRAVADGGTARSREDPGRVVVIDRRAVKASRWFGTAGAIDSACRPEPMRHGGAVTVPAVATRARAAAGGERCSTPSVRAAGPRSCRWASVPSGVDGDEQQGATSCQVEGEGGGPWAGTGSVGLGSGERFRSRVAVAAPVRGRTVVHRGGAGSEPFAAHGPVPPPG